MSVVMSGLWSVAVVIPLIAISTIVCGAISVIASFFEKTGRAQIAMARFWARSCLLLGRVRVSVDGLDKIDRKASYVFAANHLSYMDTPVVLSAIPVQFRFMAKKGLFEIPFLGTHLARAGHIPVPREDPRAAVKTLSRAAEIIRAHGISVLIFPEGGRSMDGVLQPFKEGAAYIAIKAQVPLVPVSITGTREIVPMGSATVRGGAVRLRIGDPIPTEGLHIRERGALTEAARNRIEEMLKCPV
ncbi:MAG: lysophospholipid acyltransferase family protein [Bryobacteraceae bacterium]